MIFCSYLKTFAFISASSYHHGGSFYGLKGSRLNPNHTGWERSQYKYFSNFTVTK